MSSIITTIKFLQVCANYQVALEYEFEPTFSNEDIHITSDVAGDGITNLNIGSPDIKFDEHYSVFVTVNGTYVFESNISKCNIAFYFNMGRASMFLINVRKFVMHTGM